MQELCLLVLHHPGEQHRLLARIGGSAVIDTRFTYLPEPSIRLSLQMLPDHLLRKAFEGAYETLRSLVGCRNPIEGRLIQMWAGKETALTNYTLHASREMQHREMKHDLRQDLVFAIIHDGPLIIDDATLQIKYKYIWSSTPDLKKAGLLPKWFGWRPLHDSHILAVKRENPEVAINPWRES